MRTAAVFLGGLEPGTAYRYRFVAEGDGAPGEPVVRRRRRAGRRRRRRGTSRPTRRPERRAPSCPNEALRYGASAALPDCRAYELVSPLDKEGGDIQSRARPPTSRSLRTEAPSPTPPTAPSATPSQPPTSSQYIAHRGAGGWASEAISPPQEGAPINLEPFIKTSPFAVFSSDLGEAWLQTAFEPELAPGAVAGYNNLYRRQNCERRLRRLHDGDSKPGNLRYTTPKLTGRRQTAPAGC